jgi:hypothetical protein
MNKELKEFCENYEVKILNDQKVRAKYRPPTFFADPTDAGLIRTDIVDHERERVFTVEIPESRLRTLIEMEKKFFNYQHHRHGPVDLFQVLMDKEREEAHLRQTNQAIQKAYEQYSMLLNLAGYQRKF